MRLLNVELIELPRGPTILATITGFRLLSGHEVQELEDSLKTALENDRVKLIIRTLKTRLTDNQGDLIYGWQYGLNMGEEKREIVEKADVSVREKLKKFPTIYPVNVHKRFKGDELVVLVEAVGKDPLTPEQVSGIENELSEELGLPASLDVWFKTDTIITSEGYTSFEDYNEVNVHELERILRESNTP